MENLLQGIPGVCIYIDDILITCRSHERRALEHLTEVLTRLSKAGLMHPQEGKECSFFLDSVEYLGHSKDGLHTSSRRSRLF